LCVWGFAAIFAKVSGLLLVVRLCGGAYLLYLAYGLLKSSLAPIDETQDINKTTANITRKRHPLVIGLTTNITNPKALAFFTSIFAVAMPAVASTTTQIAMLALIIVMSVAWFGFVSFCLSTPAMRTVYMRWSRWIDRVAGACLALFGIRLLSSSLKN
jgi:threonine efflux protein